MSEKKKNTKETPKKKTLIKKTTTKAPAKKKVVAKKKAPLKKKVAVKKATSKPTVAPTKKKVVKKANVVEPKPKQKVEIYNDVTTSKPLNVIQTDIKKEVVEELRGVVKATDSKSGKPNLFIRIITLDFIFNWWS